MRAAMQMEMAICEVASKSAMVVVTKTESAMDDGKMQMKVVSDL